MSQKVIVLLGVVAVLVVVLTVSCSSIERSLLYFPTHRAGPDGLTPWTKDGRVIGFARLVESPRNVWLMMHGNGGQATDRAYALPCFSPNDSVYILEYPGYGTREGTPSKKSFNAAATEAYQLLRTTYPKLPICVAAESIGSGPASMLAGLSQPPDKVVLVVPFDKLSLVAKDHYPAFIVGMLLSDSWDNVAALAHYRGPLEIFGAKDDRIIPVTHAVALAGSVPGSKFVLIEGGHNDWSHQPQVKIRNP